MLRSKYTVLKSNPKGNEMKNTSNRGRYELCINGNRIGRFTSIKTLMTIGLSGQRIRSIRWSGSVCNVLTDNVRR